MRSLVLRHRKPLSGYIGQICSGGESVRVSIPTLAKPAPASPCSLLCSPRDIHLLPIFCYFFLAVGALAHVFTQISLLEHKPSTAAFFHSVATDPDLTDRYDDPYRGEGE